MLKRLSAAVFGIGVAAQAAAADQSALLDALDAANFWAAEDWDDRDRLRAEVAAKGILALYGSGRLVPLDAEDLAEDGIVDALMRLGPHLARRGADIQSLNVIESDGVTYSVEVNGTRYDIYGPDDGAEDSWGFATETFFRIVNDLIPDHVNDRLYAIYGGNDLSGIFLPPEIVPFFAAAGGGEFRHALRADARWPLVRDARRMSGATHIAHLNWGLLKHPWDDPRVAGFTDALEAVNGLAHRSAGFVWQMDGEELERQAETAGGPFDGNPRIAMTLSVWESVAALGHFAHKTLHGKYLARRAEWFEDLPRPTYVLWPIARGHRPSLREGWEWLDHLRTNGPTDRAVDFAHARRVMAEV